MHFLNPTLVHSVEQLWSTAKQFAVLPLCKICSNYMLRVNSLCGRKLIQFRTLIVRLVQQRWWFSNVITFGGGIEPTHDNCSAFPAIIVEKLITMAIRIVILQVNTNAAKKLVMLITQAEHLQLHRMRKLQQRMNTR